MGYFYDSNSNEIGITDLTSLNVIDFEVVAHYNDSLKEKLENFSKATDLKYKTIEDDEVIVLNE